ncbi:MAG: SO_0444 family Cu/Zn efflux transporter [Gammaproteobacteria bacterium]|nr:SO_0444 family Cu/Zn efflux transporter [Gammaproteobacteria bacterium]
MLDNLTALATNFLMLWLESAPYLVLGFFIAGVMKALIPQAWMQQQLGGRSRINVIKAAFIGAPLPLCSCGVVPAAMGLRQAGASKGATVSFLVATPETGPDSVSLSYALLGPFMAIIRPIAAITSAIVAGLLVRYETDDSSQDKSSQDKSHCAANPRLAESPKLTNCCAQEPRPIEPKSCCSGTAKAPASSAPVQPPAWTQRLGAGLEYSFGQLLRDISGWLLFGLLVAATLQTFIPSNWFAEWGQGFSAMIVMALIGVPMYICASASTPIAAGFLAAGVSPGAILVFMLAGPATNIGTLGIIRKELGHAALFAYLAGVIVTALGFGWLTDYLVQAWSLSIVANTTDAHAHSVAWWVWLISGLFAVVVLKAYWQALRGGKARV